MFTEFYKDVYGTYARVEYASVDGAATLIQWDGRTGIETHYKTYKTYRAAKSAMGRMGDAWIQLIRRRDLESCKASFFGHWVVYEFESARGFASIEVRVWPGERLEGWQVKVKRTPSTPYVEANRLFPTLHAALRFLANLGDDWEPVVGIEELWRELGELCFEEDGEGVLRTVTEWEFRFGGKNVLFEAGTDREEIWAWFDENSDDGVHALMFPEDEED